MIKHFLLVLSLLARVALSANNARVFLCDSDKSCIDTHQTAVIEVNEHTMHITYTLEKGRLGLNLFGESYDIISSSKNSLTVSDKSKKIILTDGVMSIYDLDENYTMLYVMPSAESSSLIQYTFKM